MFVCFHLKHKATIVLARCLWIGERGRGMRLRLVFGTRSASGGSMGVVVVIVHTTVRIYSLSLWQVKRTRSLSAIPVAVSPTSPDWLLLWQVDTWDKERRKPYATWHGLVADPFWCINNAVLTRGVIHTECMLLLLSSLLAQMQQWHLIQTTQTNHSRTYFNAAQVRQNERRLASPDGAVCYFSINSISIEVLLECILPFIIKPMNIRQNKNRMMENRAFM